MKQNGKRRFGRLFEVLLCFLGLALFMFAERGGVRYQASAYEDPYLPKDRDYEWKAAGDEKNCLLLYHSGYADSRNAAEQLKMIFKEMRVGYMDWDLSASPLPDLGGYTTVVAAVSGLDIFGETIFDLCSWVEQGGRVMFAMPLQKDVTLDLISAKLGILESGYVNARVEAIVPDGEFMIGGGRPFTVTDPYDSSASIRVDDNCRVYAWSEDGNIPLVWARDYKEGRFVVANLGFFEKAYRGFYASAYSLLEDVCVYPVINGSAFYIDDFPSPVPQGDGTYIKRDYGLSVADFYTTVWWPDMLKLSERYGLRYTGLIIENYENRTYGELPGNGDISRYQLFGNMLLADGGELGFHGYNHQPLCLDNFVYEPDLGYKTWESFEVMQDSVEELTEFSRGIFPGERFSVYVPPSNVLSPEGRRMLGEEFPDIRCIASMYFPGDSTYEQEFEVAEDGMVETPRIISGCEIGPYMRVAALSELNMHYVNSHFLHPDDLLDPDRGAALGWENLRSSFTSYLEWLYGTAPGIRNLTGSQMAGAVERYCAADIWKMDTSEDLYVTVEGLWDEVYMFVRVNRGSLGAVKGGELTRLTDSLYLLRATQNEVEIERNR